MNSFIEENDRPTDIERRFATLLHNYLESKLDEAESQELTDLLVSSEDLRVQFVDISVQHASLAQIFQEDRNLQQIIEDASLLAPVPPRRTNRRWLTAAAILAACILFYGSFAILSVGIWRSDRPADGDANDRQTIAVLNAAENCLWDERTSALLKDPGSDSPLRAGSQLKLNRGCAEIKLAGGARVTMQAPCRLRIQADDQIALDDGRIYAVVSDSKAGFRVKTPHVTFVDRGTRFGVEVIGKVRATLHVFEGVVESVPASSEVQRPQRLVAGESIQFEGQQVRRAVADAGPFRQAMALAQRQTKSTPTTTQPATSKPEIAQAENEEKQVAAPRKGAALPGVTLLVDLEPSQIEYGLTPDPHKLFTEDGPGKMDPRCRGVFWPDARKIIKAIPADAAVPEGQPYRTLLHNDFFAVEGEFVTGVGFWARSRCMYHWLEYDIPAGAGRFTGKLLVSDDPTNLEYASANQNFDFVVSIDGKEAHKESKLLAKQVFGSGHKLADLDIAIPANARKIRFHLASTAWGDGNLNNELIVSEGTFTNGKAGGGSTDVDASPNR